MIQNGTVILKILKRCHPDYKNGKVTLTKTYDREANNESVTRPPVQDLEKLSNDQLTEIVNQILQDEKVQAIINPIQEQCKRR